VENCVLYFDIVIN